jgi:hypothetical protein
VPYWFHAAAAAWTIGMLTLAAYQPVRYEGLLQEDRFVEWWTAALFAAAGVLRLRAAWRERRVFDLLVALFCLFVAGEEFSWGQRLLGFTPPETFLRHNTQQELTLHNFADVFGRPKGVLILALLGYGVIMPGTALTTFGRRLLIRLRASSPPLAAVPWFALAALLLWWYPADYTGEWVEALAGGLFLVSVGIGAGGGGVAGLLWPLTVVAALFMTGVSGRLGTDDPARSACARSETTALVADLLAGAATEDLLEAGRVHKRLFTAALDGYVDDRRLVAFAAAPCQSGERARRRHGLDPWGMPYWIETERLAPGRRSLSVYSMGPDRRRDPSGNTGVDDVGAAGVLSRDIRP